MPEPVCRDGHFSLSAKLIAISPETHYELYHDWRKALTFCQALPDASPREPTWFHMFWRQRRGGFWRKMRPFGRKQALPVKAFFATQDLSRCSLVLWSDEDLSDNEWLRPFAPRLTFRRYEPQVEVHGTPLERWPALYQQRDRRVFRDGDLFRVLALHNYGGVCVDMDMVLLRSLGVLLDQEFVYQWDEFDGVYNGALMHLRKGGDFARELILGVTTIPAGNYNWGRENLRRAIDRGHAITVFPSPFFDTEWQADPHFKPFQNTPNSANFYHGAFAWHWHNRWDEPIREGSKFQLLETRIHEKLMGMGFSAGPSLQRATA
jgi:Glycosyltransferase sugar-binding region containing DXD motif